MCTMHEKAREQFTGVCSLLHTGPGDQTQDIRLKSKWFYRDSPFVGPQFFDSVYKYNLSYTTWYLTPTPAWGLAMQLLCNGEVLHSEMQGGARPTVLLLLLLLLLLLHLILPLLPLSPPPHTPRTPLSLPPLLLLIVYKTLLELQGDGNSWYLYCFSWELAASWLYIDHTEAQNTWHLPKSVTTL